MHILITGGAGFIGRYVARECVRQGHSVTILDSYSPQIHGDILEQHLNSRLANFITGSSNLVEQDKINFFKGDVCKAQDLEACLIESDAVVHLAAETGTGQSMYELTRYERVNIGGTAMLAEVLSTGRFPGIKCVVLASSRAIYGEGLYLCSRCGPVYPKARKTEALQAGRFEPFCAKCGEELHFSATPEDSPINPGSFYGLTKAVQEDILNMFAGKAYTLFNLRFQNVFGEMQSLHNPYTGIISIFAGLARANKQINIFEDGLESRDFIHVEDIARAITGCLMRPKTCRAITLNLGSGTSTTVLEVAQSIVQATHSRSTIEITGQFRVGDIRHAKADISAARALINFEPTVSFQQGISRFIEWVMTQEAPLSAYEQSLSELTQRGLLLNKVNQ